MLTRTILFVALLVAAPALAQHSLVPSPAQGPPHPGLTFTVTAYVVPGADGALPLPAELLERVTRESPLVELETVPAPEGRTLLQIRFGFPDAVAFNQWFEGEQTVALLRDIRERTAGGSYDSFVSYRQGHAQNTLLVDPAAMLTAFNGLFTSVCVPRTP